MYLIKWRENIVPKQIFADGLSLQVYYNILDLALINALDLYKEVTQIKISRIKFIFQLAKELRDNYEHDADNNFKPLRNIQNIENLLSGSNIMQTQNILAIIVLNKLCL